MTTKETIKEWFETGKSKGHRAMIVWCDTFDYSDYPKYYRSVQEAKDSMIKKKNLQKFMELYDLHDDMQKQLDRPWEPRLQHLSVFDDEWNAEEPGSKKASTDALEKANNILTHAKRMNIIHPGLFLTHEGGVSLEWATPENVTTVTIKRDGSFDLFQLDKDNNCEDRTVSTFAEVIEFLESQEKDINH